MIRLTSILLLSSCCLLTAQPSKSTHSSRVKTLEAIEAKESTFHGFQQFDFQIPETDAQCIVVTPKKAAKELPWVWRARFFGHKPTLDIALLEEGYHVCYVNVSNLFGSPKAMAKGETFHTFVTSKLGLKEKAVLEGMSRGGLFVFNYAAKNPDHVSAIYGDNPVCDFRSWPGGQNGTFKEGAWKKCLKSYAINKKEAQKHPQISDKQHAQKLKGIPIALVISTADKEVPPNENGDLLAKNLKAKGSPLQVWYKEGLGHHPHGLDPVEPLVKFLMQADGINIK